MNNVLLIASGGLDSTVLAYHLNEAGRLGGMLHLHYGQRHWIEASFAKITAKSLGVPFYEEQLAESVEGDHPLVGSGAIPQGDYDDDTVRSLVVPNRNAAFASYGAMYAGLRGMDTIAMGMHAGDHAIYPDCTPRWVQGMNQVLGMGFDMQLIAPFVHLTKEEIVRRGAELGVRFSTTFSCYAGGYDAHGGQLPGEDDLFFDVDIEPAPHCGQCPTCRERIQAFQRAGVTDTARFL